MDDLISKQAAVDALILLQDHSEMPEDWHKGVSSALSCLYRVPTVQPERKKGEWMFDDPISADFGCSECLHRQDYCTRYCPNCGALMWEEDDE